jgi:hypothetical protein
MKFLHLPKIAAFACCMAVCLPAALAQNSILLLNDSLIEPTASTTTLATPDVFQSTIQELSCPSTGAYGVISSAPSPQQSGNQGLLVLDQILVSVTPSGGFASVPANVCPNPTHPNLQFCFNATAVGMANYLNGYIGQDPDNTIPGSSPAQTFSQTFGVGPIDISTMLVPGSQSVNFQLQSILPPPSSNIANTTLYLNTNCTASGVSGPVTIINNPPPGDPTSPVTEIFTFDNQNNQGIAFQYTLPAGVGDLTGLTEHVSDNAIDPSTFDLNYTYGTSFSVASCYLHAGELLPNNNPACKMYALLCSQGTNPMESGALCPASAAANEIFGEAFDPPANFTLSLPDIPTPSGTFHTGVGLLMGPDSWTPAVPCVYTPGSIAAEQEQMCPQNLLYNFYGPGSSNSEGRGSNVNSTFITVYGVPEPLTTVTMTNQQGNPQSLNAGNWTNNPNQYVQLSTAPPSGVSKTALPGAAEFIAAPIQAINYGLTAPGGAVPQPAAEPITTDNTLSAPTCPTVGYAGVPPAAVFTAPVEPLTLTDGDTTPDGNYILHYYAQDCAGTQELLFLLNSQVNPPSWYTSFYTYPINLDTTPPTVTITVPAQSATYSYGQAITANVTCTDPAAGSQSTYSGIKSCDGVASPLTNGTGPQSTSPAGITVPTTTLGSNTYTVSATDYAGNSGSNSVTYTVGQGSQAITGFTLPAQVAYAPPMAPIPLSATGGASGNPVTFTVSSGPGTIACTPGCALTITGLGTVKVNANQAGNVDYTAAPQVAQSVVVSSYLAPAVSNLGASSVSPTSETLSATINPENAATTYFFTYGLTTTPSTATAPKVLPAGVLGVPVSATLTGLQANMTYYYRLTVKSLGGQVVTPATNMPPLSFTTP